MRLNKSKWKGWVRNSNWLSAIFYMTVLSAQFLGKKFSIWNRTVLSQYMVTSLMTSQWIIENLILRKRLCKFGTLCKVLVYKQFKSPFLHENSVFMWNPSSKLQEQVLKIPKYVKSQNRRWDQIFRYFDFCTPITQNQNFQQLVPFENWDVWVTVISQYLSQYWPSPLTTHGTLCLFVSHLSIIPVGVSIFQPIKIFPGLWANSSQNTAKQTLTCKCITPLTCYREKFCNILF